MKMFGCRLIVPMLVAVWMVPLAQAERYSVMRPDRETREKWIESYRNAPRAKMDRRLNMKLAVSYSLLSHLQYTPSERNQASCGDCWQWAGTGVLEIGLDVQRGIKDRLSVQFIANCHDNPNDACGCSGGWLEDVSKFYASKKYAVPWANPNAYFQNGDGQCHGTCAQIGASPNYPITSIAQESIATFQAGGQATAIANVKNVLNQNKAIWFGFFFARQTDWDRFQSFWSQDAESSIWNPDSTCGATWDSGGGGHAVLCVGYNDDDPNNSYWIMVNSWGAPTKRPNGILRWKMKMNYDCVVYDRGREVQSFYFQTLNLTYSQNQPAPEARTTPASNVTASTANLTGTVNPKGLATTCRFEYGKTTAYGASTPATAAGSGAAALPVVRTITGLDEWSTYHFRIWASNSAGASLGIDQSFSTRGASPVAPTAVTDPATDIGASSARLHGTVNPRGTAAQYFFEYGKTTAYGSGTLATSAGAGSADLAVNESLGSLDANTTYRYRVAISNANGVSRGDDRSFMTLGAPQSLLNEGFEDGALPTDWVQEYYDSPPRPEVDWLFQYGGYWAGCPDTPHSGNYNAFFYHESYEEPWSALVTPPLAFTPGKTNATLTFWHYQGMDEWWYDQDEMMVWYNATGTWEKLAHYTMNTPFWVQRTITLPNTCPGYRISFDALGFWGYGIGLDDVNVTENAPQTPSIWDGATDMGGGWKWLNWFGYFNDTRNGWIYHAQHRWMYCTGASTASIWFWTPDMYWLWSSASTYPNMGRRYDNVWLYYMMGSQNPRWFYNYYTYLWEYWY